MAYTVVLDAIPARLVQGESASWKWSDTDFPAATWTLTYTLVDSDTQIQFSASADGDDHLVELAAGTTGAYAVGDYDWQAHVTDGTERYKVAAGVIEIATDFATASSGYDARSHNKKVLDLLEAAIEGRASKTQMKQSIEGVAIEHMALGEMIKLRDQYAERYQRELVGEGKAQSRRTIKTRFTG